MPVRGRVLLFAFLLAVITYLDRIAIAAAAPAIMADLNLTVLQMSVVFSAFTLAYSIFEIPSGWLGDVKGSRTVLTRIVLWWSGFTMLTGAARGFGSLVVIRFMFGAGEAGAFPNIARTFATWFPLQERGRANGVMFLGSRVGGMLSAPLALLFIIQWGWRLTFVAFGCIGIVWAAAWFRYYWDRPEDDPSITPAELRWIQQDGKDPAHREPTPWAALLRSRNLYAICAMYFAFGYGLYFYFTWLPTYLITVLGFSAFAGGLFASLPFVLAGVADLCGGWLTDRLSRCVRTSSRAVLSRIRGVPHLRGVRAVLDARRFGGDQSRAARLCLGVGRPCTERVLGGPRGPGAGACGRHDRRHEHAWQPRRTRRPSRRRPRRRSMAVVDDSVLHHRGHLCGRGAGVAGD